MYVPIDSNYRRLWFSAPHLLKVKLSVTPCHHICVSLILSVILIRIHENFYLSLVPQFWVNFKTDSMVKFVFSFSVRFCRPQVLTTQLKNHNESNLLGSTLGCFEPKKSVCIVSCNLCCVIVHNPSCIENLSTKFNIHRTLSTVM